MNTLQQFSVFEDADFIREAIEGLCRDRLPRSSGDPSEAEARASAVDSLCWDTFPLQGRVFPYSMLVEKCSAIIARSNYGPIHRISSQDLAKEISTPLGGW